jgi:hypothetical protein
MRRYSWHVVSRGALTRVARQNLAVLSGEDRGQGAERNQLEKHLPSKAEEAFLIFSLKWFFFP